VVDTEQKLAAFLPILRAAPWVAVDTEADSLHAYPEKVCLIQISTTAGDRLVDPLAGLDLAELLETLAGHELIMHGADYDLRLLEHHHQFIPNSIFDTMLAARLIGDLQFGLGHLVEKYVGVKLEKGQQKANWALRPLTERMERYARNDTHYLKPLSDCLRAELQAKGRLAWHAESCARLIVDCTRERPANGDSAWRVKGCHLLGRPALAVLRELWRWREVEAIHANRPPFFVLSHQALVDIAAAAVTGKSFQSLLPRHMSERRRTALLKAVTHGLECKPNEHPDIIRHTGRRPSAAEHQRFVELEKRRNARAKELSLDPTLIASRSTLFDLARDWEKSAAELMKWQRHLLTA
jgi:ribonuclease D